MKLIREKKITKLVGMQHIRIDDLYILYKIYFACLLYLIPGLCLLYGIKQKWPKLTYYQHNDIRIMERKRSSGFRHIFTKSIFLFLAPVGQSLTFT